MRSFLCEAEEMRTRKKELQASSAPIASPPTDPKSFVPAPKLRRMLGISAPTLWRWRHDDALKFPKAKEM
jgi:hypothetical protein